MLRELTSGNKALYSKHTLTDIISGFFFAAKKRFGVHPNIGYATLSIIEDPLG
jgi:hypothetical protein